MCEQRQHMPRWGYSYFPCGRDFNRKKYIHVVGGVVSVFVSSQLAAVLCPTTTTTKLAPAQPPGRRRWRWRRIMCVWWAHFCVVCSFARSNFERIEPRLTHRRNVVCARNGQARHTHTHTLGIKLHVNTILTCKSLMSDGFECGLCACMCPACMWCATRLNVTHTHTHICCCVLRPRLLRACADAEVFAAQVNRVWSFWCTAKLNAVWTQWTTLLTWIVFRSCVC